MDIKTAISNERISKIVGRQKDMYVTIGLKTHDDKTECIKYVNHMLKRAVEIEDERKRSIYIDIHNLLLSEFEEKLKEYRDDKKYPNRTDFILSWGFDDTRKEKKFDVFRVATSLEQTTSFYALNSKYLYAY
jgi:hypothetical protein